MNERYGEELDKIADILQKIHPAGEFKAIGRLECVAALREVLEQARDDLDPEMPRRDIVAMREQFVKACQ